MRKVGLSRWARCLSRGLFCCRSGPDAGNMGLVLLLCVGMFWVFDFVSTCTYGRMAFAYGALFWLWFGICARTSLVVALEVPFGGAFLARIWHWGWICACTSSKGYFGWVFECIILATAG